MSLISMRRAMYPVNNKARLWTIQANIFSNKIVLEPDKHLAEAFAAEETEKGFRSMFDA